jgi:AcrR family transcriptional regulator
MADRDDTRQRRANGEASRSRILDAAVEVASERGYEGTSIALVREKCGLPSSSIYWHFQNKEELIAAVIKRSFDTFVGALSLPDGDGALPERVTAMAVGVAKALLETPEFLRLGLMLALEHRPEEPSARTMFLRVRHIAHRKLVRAFCDLVPNLDASALNLLATYAIAGADGLFIAREIGGDGIDLVQLFELHARALVDMTDWFSTKHADSPRQPEVTSDHHGSPN